MLGNSIGAGQGRVKVGWQLPSASPQGAWRSCGGRYGRLSSSKMSASHVTGRSLCQPGGHQSCPARSSGGRSCGMKNASRPSTRISLHASRYLSLTFTPLTPIPYMM